jgi:predicted nucleic acid-binding protein
MSATPETAATQATIIFDATILSNFARIGQTSWLERVYASRACTTLMVAEEIRQGVEAGYRALDSIERALRPAGWLPVVGPETTEEQILYLDLLSSLGSGEASCLAIAKMRDMVLATDDRAARQKAAEQGVRVTGTLGILIRLVRDGHLSLPEANGCLAEMVQQGYRSPVEQLDEFL